MRLMKNTESCLKPDKLNLSVSIYAVCIIETASVCACPCLMLWVSRSTYRLVLFVWFSLFSLLLALHGYLIPMALARITIVV